MRYRPEIDGLRTIAVVPVVLFHAGVPLFAGGFVGVDVFFVISGYLITSILLKDLKSNEFRIIRFWERRARRILPALIVVVLCTLPPALLLLPPTQLGDYAESVVGVATFSSNFVFWHQADYFNGASELNPLLHTWSLAVEEQYYILFPLLLALLWKSGQKVMFAAIAAGTIASLGLAENLSQTDSSGNFFLLPTRAWELGIGALIAIYFCDRSPPKPGTWVNFAALCGLALIFCSVLAFDQSTPIPGKYGLLPTIGAALIIIFAVDGTLAGRILALRPMVALGLISYSTYLWHQPLFAFARFAVPVEPSPYLMAILVLASFGVAWLSWLYVERPFRDRQLISRRLVFRTALAATASLLGIGLAVQAGSKNIARWSSQITAPRLLEYRYDNFLLRSESWNLLNQVAPVRSSGANDIPVERLPWFDQLDPRRRLLLVGNSHSKDIYNSLVSSRVAQDNFQIARFGVEIASISGTNLYTSPNYRMADVIMIASRYWPDDVGHLANVVERSRRDGKLVVLVRNIFPFQTFKFGMLTRADVIVLDAIANHERDGAAIRSRSDRAYFQEFNSRPRPEEVADSDEAIDKIVQNDPDVIALDRMKYICDAGNRRCFSMDRKLNKYFYDYGHQTLEGARFFGKRIDEIGWLQPLLSAAPARQSEVPSER